MAIIQQKLFKNTVTTWEEIRNMGMVKYCKDNGGACYSHHYRIELDKEILNFIDVDKLKEIIQNHFSGYFGGYWEEFTIFGNVILARYTGCND